VDEQQPDTVTELAEVIAAAERQPLGDSTHRRHAIARAVLASGVVVPRADAVPRQALLDLADQWETDTTETWWHPESEEYGAALRALAGGAS